MAKSLSVVALPMGWLETDKASLTYGKDYGKTIWIPVWSAAILGAEAKIVVDTGMDLDWVRATLGPGCRIDHGEGVEDALKTIGWTPDDVDIVINTHLHHDHMCGNHLFPRAQFVVQEREWRAALNPLETQAWAYAQDAFKAVDYFRWQFVNGICDIVPGVRVMPTPGHSTGHQSVLVNNSGGCIAITGDAANLLENLQEVIPPGILTSIEDALQSIRLLRRVVDYVLTGHEPSITPFAKDSELPHFQRA